MHADPYLLSYTVEARPRPDGFWQVISEHDTLAVAYARLRSEWKRAENGATLRLTTREKGARA